MPAILLAIWEGLVALWAFLVEVAPWLGRFVPWCLALWAPVKKFMAVVLAWFAADTIESLKKGTVGLFVQTACLVVWGIFLAAVMTGITGLGIREVCFRNPFTGFPSAMMFLVVHAFPVKFAFSLMSSYIIFKFTFAKAALVMSRSIKFLFGA